MHEDPRGGGGEHDGVTLRILILDDHRLLVEALAARLGTEPDLLVAARAPGGIDTVVGYAARTRPDVVVMEVAPFDEERRELLLRLGRRLPAAHVVALTAADDTETAAEVVRLGVEGWVSKEAAVEDLVAMVRAAARGRGWFPPRQLGAVMERLRAEARREGGGEGPLDALTDREREILTAMVDGHATTAVARALHVSANTVRTHVSSIYEKLGVHSRLEAVALARQYGAAPATAAAPVAR
jgi:two-component system nitrate/nitrite response regulator NarL